MEEGDSSLSQSPAFYAPLLRAILDDDWNAAKAFIRTNPGCLRAAITKDQDTALHLAAAAKRTRFVKELVKLMKPEELEMEANHVTALYFAAQTKNVTIAEVMVRKNRKLPSIIPKNHTIQDLPLYAAIQSGNRDMVSYLYCEDTIYKLEPLDRIELLMATISTNLYDTALKMLDTLKYLRPEEKDPELFWFPLRMLARKPWDIGNKSQPSVWERCLNSYFRGWLCNKAIMQASAHQLVDRLMKELGEAYQQKMKEAKEKHKELEEYQQKMKELKEKHKEELGESHQQIMKELKEKLENINFLLTMPERRTFQLLVEAAKAGNIEFLIIFIRSYPHLIWEVDEEDGTLFHVAIKHRQEHVFNLIHEIGDLKGILTSHYAGGTKSMLDLAGEFPSSDRLNIISGAALQMQRELLWFQEIEKIVPKSSVNGLMGPEEKLPRNIFVETHEKLQESGEKWMRNTAESCMLVAALIATVVFPAAFTVPGGNNQETGIPIFLKTNWFTVFLVSNAVAMLFSSSSILIFLSILTSRYTVYDFLKSLPLRLAFGLGTLLISIASMLIAFTAACVLVFKGKISVPIRIIFVVASAIPVCLFVILHFRLWFDIFRSAFFSNWTLFRSHNRLFNSKLALNACYGN